MPDYMTFYNLLRKEGRVGKDFASEIAEELVTLTAIAADRATAPVSVAPRVWEGDKPHGANYAGWRREVIAAQPAADNAPQAPSTSSVPAAMGMLRCLQYVECVYRLNCVAEGEPSSTLKYMQDVIAANAQGSMGGEKS